MTGAEACPAFAPGWAIELLDAQGAESGGDRHWISAISLRQLVQARSAASERGSEVSRELPAQRASSASAEECTPLKASPALRQRESSRTATSRAGAQSSCGRRKCV